MKTKFQDQHMKLKNALKLTKSSILIFLSGILTASCASVPFTGRRQLNLVSNDQVIALSLQQYQDFMRTAPVERGSANAEMVNRIGNRMANAVTTFYKSNNYEDALQNYQWEFKLVKDNSVNAFAMPGGKVVVYTGILPVTQTEEALAVVIGHEIAHVIAQHSAERLSQQIALQYGGAFAGSLLGNSAGVQLGQQVFGLGAQVGVMMPYARKQEYEADEIGLIIMALAGYNPQAAVPFWTRMAQNSGSSTPEFLSTHPTDAKRIANIQNIMPKVLQYYKGNGIQNTNTTSTIKTQANPKTDTSVDTKNAKTSQQWHF